MRSTNKRSFARVSTFRVPMSLTLEFDRAVHLAEAREAARRLLDRTCVVEGGEVPDGCAEAKITCASLRRTIRWSPDEEVGDA